MTNEIKELLDRAKNLKYKCDCCEEIALGKYVMRDDKQTDNLIEAVYIIDKLLDYITNLQEEKQRLLESADCLSKGYSDLEKRIDKAVEYIKWNLDKNEELIEYFNYDGNFNELLKILKGEE